MDTHTMPKLNMHGVLPPFPMRLHCVALNYAEVHIYFSFNTLPD